MNIKLLLLIRFFAQKIKKYFSELMRRKKYFSKTVIFMSKNTREKKY